MKLSLKLTGSKLSDETKNKISLSKIGIKNPKSLETKNKISATLKGHNISLETRKKISETLKERNKTTTISDITRKKISEKIKNRAKLHCEFCRNDIDPGNFAKHHGIRCKLNSNITRSNK